MSRLREFIGSKEIEIDGKKLELKPLKEDKWAIMEINEKRRKGDLVQVDFKRLHDTLAKIIKQSISDATDDEIEELLVTREDSILMELGIIFGWLTREQMNKLKDDLKKGIVPTVQNEPKKTSEQK